MPSFPISVQGLVMASLVLLFQVSHASGLTPTTGEDSLLRKGSLNAKTLSYKPPPLLRRKVAEEDEHFVDDFPVERASKGSKGSKKMSSKESKGGSSSSAPPPPPSCEIPPPHTTPDPFEDIKDVTSCPGNTRLTINNTLVQLQKDINCVNLRRSEYFLRIEGDNNTVDCGGFTVATSRDDGVAFLFFGRNNVLQNCPNIIDFNEVIVVPKASSLHVINVTAASNDDVLVIRENAVVFVDASDFSENANGIRAVGEINSPFKVIVVNGIITRNIFRGAFFRGSGEACLEGNDISGNYVNVAILDFSGTPNVSLVNNNACDSTCRVDIADDTNATTTTIFNTTCSFIHESKGDNDGEKGDALNATVYGCEPCPV